MNKDSDGVAVFVKEVAGMKGDAAVYELIPTFGDHRFVVVSAVEAWGAPETLIFPSDGDKVADFLDIAGIAYWSHAGALAELGHKIGDKA